MACLIAQSHLTVTFSRWNTKNVQDMRELFREASPCSIVPCPILEHQPPANVENMYSMFMRAFNFNNNHFIGTCHTSDNINKELHFMKRYLSIKSWLGGLAMCKIWTVLFMVHCVSIPILTGIRGMFCTRPKCLPTQKCSTKKPFKCGMFKK